MPLSVKSTVALPDDAGLFAVPVVGVDPDVGEPLVPDGVLLLVLGVDAAATLLERDAWAGAAVGWFAIPQPTRAADELRTSAVMPSMFFVIWSSKMSMISGCPIRGV